MALPQVFACKWKIIILFKNYYHHLQAGRVGDKKLACIKIVIGYKFTHQDEVKSGQ